MFQNKIIQINYLEYLFFHFKEKWTISSLRTNYKSWFLETLNFIISRSEILENYIITLSEYITLSDFKENLNKDLVLEVKKTFEQSLKREIIKNLLKWRVWQ